MLEPVTWRIEMSLGVSMATTPIEHADGELISVFIVF